MLQPFQATPYISFGQQGLSRISPVSSDQKLLSCWVSFPVSWSFPSKIRKARSRWGLPLRPNHTMWIEYNPSFRLSPSNLRMILLLHHYLENEPKGLNTKWKKKIMLQVRNQEDVYLFFWVTLISCNGGQILRIIFCLENDFMEFLLWLCGLRTWHSVHEDVGFIPGLAQWVKELVLLQAAA